jgi:ribonuclease Z
VDLNVTFLGTGGSAPTARRSTASVLVAAGGDRLMFDCGEGTQRQMQRSTGLVQVDDVFLSHFHADHFLGLPGLLKTYDLGSRSTTLRVFGPPGLRDLFSTMRRIAGRTRYEVELTEIEPGEEVRREGYAVRAFAVEHRTTALGFALVEDERPGRFDPAAARRLGVPEGPAFGELQRGRGVAVGDRTVAPEEVMGEARAARRIVITGDTAPCMETVEQARGAQLLVHDASFTEAEAQRAAETGHSTAGQAGALAREAGVGLLALVHISSRYHVKEVLEEAREEFPAAVAPRDFDQVEIPLPERGEPRLVQNGARERGAGGEGGEAGTAAGGGRSRC